MGNPPPPRRAAARAGRLAPPQLADAKQEFAALVDDLAIVEVTEELVATAADLAEDEALRGYDAVHLAAALTLGAEVLCSADTDLCAAAARRGLHVANPNTPTDDPKDGHTDETE